MKGVCVCALKKYYLNKIYITETFNVGYMYTCMGILSCCVSNFHTRAFIFSIKN